MYRLLLSLTDYNQSKSLANFLQEDRGYSDLILESQYNGRAVVLLPSHYTRIHFHYGITILEIEVLPDLMPSMFDCDGIFLDAEDPDYDESHADYIAEYDDPDYIG